MKSASIVSLIVAVVIIAAGIITCTVANNKAEANGNPLFAQARGDDFVRTVDLSENNVSRISLDFADADVNIYGSSSASYIEFVNFSETLYSLNITNTSLSFSEIPDISSMLRFWESGFTFKGMRFILNPRTYDNSRMKSINIYLTQDYNVKQIEIDADKATVSIENLSCSADYVITAEELTLYSSSVRTDSMLKINSGKDITPAKKAKLDFSASRFGSVSISADELELSGETYGLSSGTVVCKTGSIDWNTSIPEISAPIPEKIQITTGGMLSVNGKVKESPFTFDSTTEEEPAKFSLDISASDASVAVTVPYLSEKSTKSSDADES